MNISVVVAAFNEEAVITQNIERIIAELSSRPEVEWELICVNDGSRDRTGPLLDEAAQRYSKLRVIHLRRNFGQGRALRTGFDICQGSIIVTLDADLSYGPEYIFTLADALENQKVEIALASPYSKGGAVKNIPFYRYILSKWGNRYLARMSSYDISTSTCVVRAYAREVMDGLLLTSDGMELQVEILMKAALMGFQICEIPAELSWTEQKTAQEGVRRVSKMRILRNIRLYLFMGWLQRPAFIFFILSWFLIIPGLYTAVAFIGVTYGLLKANIPLGIAAALHLTLKELVDNYYQNIIFGSALLIFGFLCFAFSLLFLQNKMYFEELFILTQRRGLKKTWVDRHEE